MRERERVGGEREKQWEKLREGDKEMVTEQGEKRGK